MAGRLQKGSIPLQAALVNGGVKMSPTQKIALGRSPWPLWGCLALDAFYLLTRDVDRSSEPLGLDNPSFDHVLDLPTGETEVLGCLHHGELLAVIVLHATNLLARQRPGSRHPIRIPRRCDYIATRRALSLRSAFPPTAPRSSPVGSPSWPGCSKYGWRAGFDGLVLLRYTR